MKTVLAIIWILVDILLYCVGVELVSTTYWIVNVIFAVAYLTTHENKEESE